MKVKPKEILINVPVALLFDIEDEAANFASNLNTIMHGKVKLKYDNLGYLNNKTVFIFYLQRNDEYHQIRDEFVRLIEQEEINFQSEITNLGPEDINLAYDPNFGDNKICECGHPYYRHFDTYDDMAAIGCKYCSCFSYGPNFKHTENEYCPYFKEKKEIE